MTDQDLAPAQNGNRAARPSERPPNLLNYLLKKGRGQGGGHGARLERSHLTGTACGSSGA